MDTFYYIKIKNAYSPKDAIKEGETRHRTGRKIYSACDLGLSRTPTDQQEKGNIDKRGRTLQTRKSNGR